MESKTPQTPQEPAEHHKGNKPRYISRSERRASYRTVYNNNRKPKNQGFLNMGIAWDNAAIFFPKRKKLKGYQKNQKRYPVMEAKKTEQPRLFADDAQLFEPEYSADNNTANNILFAFITLIVVLAIIGFFGIIYHFIDFWQWILN